jgi:hypothetical protein
VQYPCIDAVKYKYVKEEEKKIKVLCVVFCRFRLCCLGHLAGSCNRQAVVFSGVF